MATSQEIKEQLDALYETFSTEHDGQNQKQLTNVLEKQSVLSKT